MVSKPNLRQSAMVRVLSLRTSGENARVDHSIALRSDEIQVLLGTAAGFRRFVLTLRENGNVPEPEDFNREKYPIGKNNARNSRMGNGRALCVIERKSGGQPCTPAA